MRRTVREGMCTYIYMCVCVYARLVVPMRVAHTPCGYVGEYVRATHAVRVCTWVCGCATPIVRVYMGMQRTGSASHCATRSARKGICTYMCVCVFASVYMYVYMRLFSMCVCYVCL